MSPEAVAREPGPLLARGRTAEVYDWQPGQVLKLFFDWCSPQWAAQEALINTNLTASGLPTPRLLAEVNIQGRTGLVFERVRGVTLLRVLETQPWRVAEMARLLAELHAEVHRVRIPALPSLRESLKFTIAHVELLSEAQRTGVLALLERLPDGETLCHFDFHPDQVVLTREGPMILDWLTAMRGDPAADVARTALILAVARAPHRGSLTTALISWLQGSYRHAYLRRYWSRNPEVHPAQVEAWTVPIAAARLMEGIANEKQALLRLVATGLEAAKAGTDGSPHQPVIARPQ